MKHGGYHLMLFSPTKLIEVKDFVPIEMLTSTGDKIVFQALVKSRHHH